MLLMHCFVVLTTVGIYNTFKVLCLLLVLNMGKDRFVIDPVSLGIIC